MAVNELPFEVQEIAEGLLRRMVFAPRRGHIGIVREVKQALAVRHEIIHLLSDVTVNK